MVMKWFNVFGSRNFNNATDVICAYEIDAVL